MNLSDLILLFPDRCPYCNKTIKRRETACKKCKTDLPSYTATRFAKGGYYCYSPFIYSGKYANAVKRLKFNDRTAYTKKLAYPLSNAVGKINKEVKFDYVTCVPMHKRKLRERGYNQAELLAKDLSKLINVPYLDTLIKIKDNKEQHKCTAKERSQNVKGVYKTDIAVSDTIKNKNLLIVDDIITTGYTLGECCKTLNRSGANEIYCVTVCATNN